MASSSTNLLHIDTSWNPADSRLTFLQQGSSSMPGGDFGLYFKPDPVMTSLGLAPPEPYLQSQSLSVIPQIAENLNPNESPRQNPANNILKPSPTATKTYNEMIMEAIESSPEKRLTLSQIYDWMITYVPVCAENSSKEASAGWKNCIRHNLSLHKHFKRIPVDARISYWVIDYEELRRRKMEKEAKKAHRVRSRSFGNSKAQNPDLLRLKGEDSGISGIPGISGGGGGGISERARARTYEYGQAELLDAREKAKQRKLQMIEAGILQPELQQLSIHGFQLPNQQNINFFNNEIPEQSEQVMAELLNFGANVNNQYAANEFSNGFSNEFSNVLQQQTANNEQGRARGGVGGRGPYSGPSSEELFSTLGQINENQEIFIQNCDLSPNNSVKKFPGTDPQEFMMKPNFNSVNRNHHQAMGTGGLGIGGSGGSGGIGSGSGGVGSGNGSGLMMMEESFMNIIQNHPGGNNCTGNEMEVCECDELVKLVNEAMANPNVQAAVDSAMAQRNLK